MKKIVLFVWMSMVLICSSCIEEYNELPGVSSDPVLVIEGHIISDYYCSFSLRQSGSLDDPSSSFLPVSGASVFVKGSDGTSWKAYEWNTDPGQYHVYVSTLSPDVSYWLYVDHPDYGVFQSEPQVPLDAPEIASIGFVGGNATNKVSITIGTGELTELTYLMWTYEEYWKVITPMIAVWSYDPETDSFYRNYNYTNKGWGSKVSNFCVVSSNVDFGGKTISKMALYSRNRDDICFQTRYCTRVRQMAISEKEYEYWNQVKQQSLEMGGLFTPMPSELSSNIKGENGKVAFGYVGVRGKTGFNELYINRRDVGCARNDFPTIISGDDVKAPITMYKMGYVSYDYIPGLGASSWTNSWAVDCRDPYWGNCTLECPYFWVEE